MSDLSPLPSPLPPGEGNHNVAPLPRWERPGEGELIGFKGLFLTGMQESLDLGLILFPPLSATENSRKCYTAAASPWKTALPFCGMAHMGCTVDLLSIIGNPCPMLFLVFGSTAIRKKKTRDRRASESLCRQSVGGEKLCPGDLTTPTMSIKVNSCT